MSDVIPLKTKKEEPKPLIWVCECGCCTYELFSDSTVRCAVCGEATGGPDGGWDVPETDKKWDGEAPVRDISGNGSEVFARRRMDTYVKDPNACVIIVFDETGSIHTWSKVETKAQLEWFREKLDATYELVSKRIADE
jgi:hypothetical protein